MYSRILKQMWEAVRLRNYVVTVHATEEMDDDGFSIFDVEHCIQLSVRKSVVLLSGNI